MTQKARVLAMLRSGETTTAELAAAFIPRYGARIEELRREGFVIERRRVSASSFAYRLVPPAPVRTSPVAPSPNSTAATSVGEARRETPLSLFPLDRIPLGAYESEAA